MYLGLWIGMIMCWPQNKCRSLLPIFHGQVILPYILDYSMYKHHYLGLWVSMTWFDLKISIGHCYLYFMVQWFCVISWRLFDVWTSYFGIMGQYYQMFEFKTNVGLCDLHFMVQWFYLISPRLFGARVSYFQIMRQCDSNFDLKVNI